MSAPTDLDLAAFAWSLFAMPAPYLPGDRIAKEGRTSSFGLPGYMNTSSWSTFRKVYALEVVANEPTSSMAPWFGSGSGNGTTGDAVALLRGLSIIAVNRFNLFNGIPRCFIRFGSDTEASFFSLA
jgi:hypothetical protein